MTQAELDRVVVRLIVQDGQRRTLLNNPLADGRTCRDVLDEMGSEFHLGDCSVDSIGCVLLTVFSPRKKSKKSKKPV